MKHYTNVIKDDVSSVHALYDGETATACGAINAADTMGSTRAVSCDACMKAIINQQRASDHRMPVQTLVLHHNFSTHQASWRKAIAHLSERSDLDAGERAYWQHELAAFDLAYSTFDHSLATGADDMPKVIQTGGPVPHTPINSIKIIAYGQDGRVVQAGTRSSRDPLLDFEILLNTPAQHMTAPPVSRDAVVEANRKLLLDRSNVGIEKYGVTLEQSGLTQRQFIQHALEEVLDLANYLQATLMTTPDQQQ